MSLPGQVEAALSLAPGFDTDAVISAAAAQQFFAAGYKYCLRYISLTTDVDGCLSVPEALDILNSGLALMPVQHVRGHAWAPSAALGQQDGEQAAANAQAVGFLPGVNLWCDLEDVIPGTA